MVSVTLLLLDRSVVSADSKRHQAWREPMSGAQYCTDMRGTRNA